MVPSAMGLLLPHPHPLLVRKLLLFLLGLGRQFQPPLLVPKVLPPLLGLGLLKQPSGKNHSFYFLFLRLLSGLFRPSRVSQQISPFWTLGIKFGLSY